jgi:hypothetical protein
LSYSHNVNERVIYILVADGQLVKAYSDIDWAREDYQKLLQFAKPGSKISPPIACKFADNQTINSKLFNKVKTGEW